MGRTFSSLSRLRQISAVLMRHGLGHLLEKRRHAKGQKTLPADAAERFRRVLEELGPTFIKFGQVLSTRSDLLPPNFIDALSQLQTDVAPLDIGTIQAQLHIAFGERAEQLFAQFDPVPVASASIAQVHKARLHDGRDVAVKVQRPNLRAQIAQDFDLLHVLAQLCQNLIEESGMVAPRALVSEFETMLQGELDFAKEAGMLRRFWHNAQKPRRTYVVPELVAERTAGPVLTMTWLSGRKLAEVDIVQQGEQVAQNVVQACFDQLFVDGLFHADPHPGNCLVLEDGRLALLDFGATARLTPLMREVLVGLVVAVGMHDGDAVGRLLYRMAAPTRRVQLASLCDACAALIDERLRDRETFLAQSAAVLLQDLLLLAASFGLRVPSQFALLSRAALTVEGSLRVLDPQLRVVDASAPLLRRLIEEPFRVSQLTTSALRNVVRARDVARSVPMLVSQLAMDIECGRLRMQMDNPQLAVIARNIDTLGVVIFMGLIAGALIVGAMVALSQYDARMFGLPILPMVALYGASMLFGTALGRWWLAPRWRKISLRRWLRRRTGAPPNEPTASARHAADGDATGRDG